MPPSSAQERPGEKAEEADAVIVGQIRRNSRSELRTLHYAQIAAYYLIARLKHKRFLSISETFTPVLHLPNNTLQRGDGRPNALRGQADAAVPRCEGRTDRKCV